MTTATVTARPILLSASEVRGVLSGKRAGCSWESNPWTWCIEFKKQETQP